MSVATDSTRVVLARRRAKSDTSESSDQDELEGAADLSALLCSEIRNSLPNLLDTLRIQLDGFTSERKAIGEPKKTHSERLVWLLNITKEYERQVELSLSHPGEVDSDAVAVRAMVIEMNSRFSRFMRLYGGHYRFEYEDADPQTLLTESVHWWQSKFSEWNNPDAAAPPTPISQAPFEIQRQPPPRAPEMEIDSHITALASSQELMSEITHQVRRFSTLAPGIINPRILENLFRVQTQKWLAISLNLLDSVSFRVEEAARYILDVVCPPSGATSTLRQALQDHISSMHEEATAEAKKVLEEFVSTVRENIMQTTDPMFREEVQMWAYIRSFKALQDPAASAENPLKSCHAFFNMVARSAHKNIEAEVHDVTRVYYSHTLEYFIRHVTGTVIERFVCASNSTLRALSTDYIMKLKKDEVERLVKEDQATVERRKLLDEEISRRERALKIAQRARNQSEGIWF
ncbi:uncharacterized protein DNG_02136 [Cephalotrichum gorgonifer]|uniref:GED domain-containing protein n=1 Tax=Cephalotrichum gorgonifer TaxID=2041049 RepID=A0AAE8MT50_9PEZI|nr:uncharacterized protein DNG_02136 [Cephalotrichum gorgonifer]